MQIVQYANEKEFTSVIVVHTNRREPGHILEHITFLIPLIIAMDCVSAFIHLSSFFVGLNCQLDHFFFHFLSLDALLIIGLPDGPTAHFKLSKLMLRKDIKVQ